MYYSPKQFDIGLLSQTYKGIYIRIEVINRAYAVLESLEGELISGTLNINSASSIRRILNLDLFVTKKIEVVDEFSKIWMDKYFRFYIGYEYLPHDQVYWYPLGIFALNESSYEFNATTKKLSMSCMDLMSTLSGDLGGAIHAPKMMAKRGEDVRSVLVSFVTNVCGIKKYYIEDVKQTLPYDISVSSGASKYDFLRKIVDLYPAWEIFFDVFGTLVIQKIPSMISDTVILNNEILSQTVISEGYKYKFTDVYNIIDVFGDVLSYDFASSDSILMNGVYSATISNVTEFKDYQRIAIPIILTNPDNAKVKFNSMSEYDLVDSNGKPLKSGYFLHDHTYILQFKKGKMYVLGRYTIRAIAIAVNKMPSNEMKLADKAKYGCQNIEYVIDENNPFTREKIGSKELQLSGGDYSKIYADDLAMQRAKYELWTKSRLVDQLSFSHVIIPWLDVNLKIESFLRTNGKIIQSITKSISMDFMNGTMTVSAMRFYPLYPWL